MFRALRHLVSSPSSTFYQRKATARSFSFFGLGAAISATVILAQSQCEDARTEENTAPAQFTGNVCIFSGGTGFNQSSRVLKEVCPRVHYILPISDDGGSTAEIIRTLGGPSIGDIRSRLLNLASDGTEECKNVKRLLQHRLSLDSEASAKAEWNEIVEGNHPYWDGISPAYKATIRRFLVVFADQILTRGCDFQFRNGSIGNFFFTGSRIFFASVEAAIFWFSRVAAIPSTSSVIPVVVVDHSITVGAYLADGHTIIGQHNISHPTGYALPQVNTELVEPPAPRLVDKGKFSPLPSPIDRIFYVNTDKQVITPKVNPRAIQAIQTSDRIVYSMGSLYTSIIPTLILPGVGEAIAESGRKKKILIFNGQKDRESGEMTPLDCVVAVSRALNRYQHNDQVRESDYINTVVIPSSLKVCPCQEDQLSHLGIHLVRLPTIGGYYDDKVLVDYLTSQS